MKRAYGWQHPGPGKRATLARLVPAFALLTAASAGIYACKERSKEVTGPPPPRFEVGAPGGWDLNQDNTPTVATPFTLTVTSSGGYDGLWKFPTPFGVGSGLINPFMRVQNNGSEQGFNTSNGTPYDDKPGTVALPLNHVPIIKHDGGFYREFIIDANENNNAAGDWRISIDIFDVWVCDDNGADQYTTFAQFESGNPNCKKVYDLGGHVGFATDALTSGGGQTLDYDILIPEQAFTDAFSDAETKCPYQGVETAACGYWVIVRTLMGAFGTDANGHSWASDATFEEISTIKRGFVTVTKTAVTSYTRTYKWVIEKEVSPTVLHVWDGESNTASWTVRVRPDPVTPFEDSNREVNGLITITNPSTEAVTIASKPIDVMNPGGLAATVTCPSSGPTTGFPFVLNAGATLECSYTRSLTTSDPLTNTASVELADLVVVTAQAAVAFGAPTTEVNKIIHVTDVYQGGAATPLGTADHAVGTTTFTFTETPGGTFNCPTDKGTKNNTARIVETNQTANASLVVNCYTLNVSKTAVAARTTEFTWTILKQVKKAGAADATYAASTSFSMIQGDQAEVTYRVGLTRTTASDQSKVTGVITITNPATSSGPVVVRNVADQILGQASAATITGCATSAPAAIPIPVTSDNTTWHTLAANSSITCDYTYDFPAGAPPTGDQTNRATVVGAKPAPPADATKSFTDDEVFNFAGVVPTIIGFESVNVGDPDQPTPNPRGPFSETASYVYNKTFTCNADVGAKVNTATIVEIPTLFSSATVNIACATPTVTKTATTTFTRSWDWTILKEAGDNPDAPLVDGTLNLSIGQTYSFNYKVTVGIKSGWPQDGEWKVSGMINVANPAPPGTGVKIKSVTDEISSAPVVQPSVSNCTVDAAAVATPTAATPYVLDGGKTLICEYGPTDLQDGTTRTNTATAVKIDRKHTVTVDDITPEATRNYSNADIDNVVFGATPTKKVDNCVNVSDLQADPTLLGTVCEDDDPAPPKSFTYSLTIGPFAVCGAYDFPNTASFTSDGASEFSTPRTGESRFNVPILVACAPAGCTLTQGYWKTHNSLFGADKNGGRKGPPIHDWSAATAWTTWESWTFFGGTPAPVPPGVTAVPVPPVGSPSWFATFTTQPKGNPYYQAAHQFMAAMLNGANGADGSSVGTELGEAYTFFLTAVPGTTWSRGERTKLIGWNSLFASYNEGTLIGGPPHCDEDATSAR